MRKGYIVIGLVLLAGIAYASFQHADVAGYRTIGPEEAYEFNQNGAFVLDVRTVNEFEESHIPGAVNIPVERPNRLREEWSQVPKDRPVVVICRSGRRSVTASEFLVNKGYSEVYNVGGGMQLWRAKGLPMEN